MAATRVNASVEGNRNCSDSPPSQVPIPPKESELFKDRLKEVIGENTIVGFAKLCGFSDSLMGSYLRGEKRPGLDYLVAIADAGGVTVDWLATGRLPKIRAELRDLVGKAAVKPPAGRINVEALEAILEGALKIGRDAPASAIAAHCANVYNDVLERGLITSAGLGAGDLDTAA